MKQIIGLEERNEMYLTSLISRMPIKNKDYYLLPKFYQINIDNFIKYKNDILRCSLYDSVVKEKINSKMEKIRKRCCDNDEIKGNVSFEDKLFLALIADKDELEKLCTGNEILEKVRDKIMFLNEEYDLNSIGEYDFEED